MAAGWAAVILAAGASERMGAPKALLPWGGTTLLGYAIDQARAAGVDEIVAVLGQSTSHAMIDARAVINPDPSTGRSASIRLGAAALAHGVDAIVVQSVDQPVPSTVLESLYKAIGPEVDVAIPTFAGRGGHPIAFRGHLLGELQEVTEADQGLRAVVRRHAARVKAVPVASESVLWNLNDPEAYATAHGNFSRVGYSA